MSTSFHLNPADWRLDYGLRACSLPARGLWVDLLCMMHESPERGVLLVEPGVPTPDRHLARAIGCTPATLRRLLAELESVGVSSRRPEDGAIVCGQMVGQGRYCVCSAEEAWA